MINFILGGCCKKRRPTRASQDEALAGLHVLKGTDIVAGDILLGAGSFGPVLEGRVSFSALEQQEHGLTAVAAHDVPGASFIVAVKTLPRASAVEQARRLAALNSPHIIKLLGVSFLGDVGRLALELCAFGALPQYLRDHAVTAPHKLSIARDVAKAVKYIHESARHVHGHLAACHVLINGQRLAKLGDGGVGRHFVKADQSCCADQRCTPRCRWASPEVLDGACVSGAGDIWSFGVFLYELASNASLPLESLSSTEEVVAAVLGGQRLQPPPSMSASLGRLMLRCFGTPDARPTADELVRALIAAEFMPEISRITRTLVSCTLNGGTSTPTETSPLLPRGPADSDSEQPGRVVLLAVPLHNGIFVISEEVVESHQENVLADEGDDERADGGEFNPYFPTMDIGHHNHARPPRGVKAPHFHHHHRHRHHHHDHHQQQLVSAETDPEHPHHHRHHHKQQHDDDNDDDDEAGDASFADADLAARVDLDEALDAAFADLDDPDAESVHSTSNRSRAVSTSTVASSESDDDSSSSSSFGGAGLLFPATVDADGHVVPHTASPKPSSAFDLLRTSMMDMIDEVLSTGATPQTLRPTDLLSDQMFDELLDDAETESSRRSTYENDWQLHAQADSGSPPEYVQRVSPVKSLFTDNIFDAILEGSDSSDEFEAASLAAAAQSYDAADMDRAFFGGLHSEVEPGSQFSITIDNDDDGTAEEEEEEEEGEGEPSTLALDGGNGAEYLTIGDD